MDLAIPMWKNNHIFKCSEYVTINCKKYNMNNCFLYNKNKFCKKNILIYLGHIWKNIYMVIAYIL